MLFNNNSNTHSSNSNIRRISTLYIARVIGFSYPSIPENENAILEEYFDTPRPLREGDCVLIRKEHDSRYSCLQKIDFVNLFII